MKHSDVIKWLYSEIDAVLAATGLVSLTDRDAHIGLARERTEYPYPFVAIDHDDGEPRSAGIGAGTAFVHSLNYDDTIVEWGTQDWGDGEWNAVAELQSITYRRDVQLDVTIQTLTDGDRQLRDDLSQELQGHFAVLSRQDDYDPDIKRLEVRTGTPTSRPERFVYGDGTDILVEYSTFVTDTDPDVAKQVDLTVEAAEDTDGRDSSSTDYTVST